MTISAQTYSSSRIDPVALGTLFNVVSALAYTAANVCLRDASRTCDPVWISCIKALPTALVAWTLIGHRASRGLPALPSRRLLPTLIGTALLMQLGGNISFQWALPILGLTLSVPLVFGTLIIGGALAGRFYLQEGIVPRTLAAMLVLIAAICVLSWGAENATPLSLDAAANPWLVTIAVAVTCFSGFCYAACNVLIRRVAGPNMPLSATLMVMSTTGFISLGIVALGRIGWAGIVETTPHEWLAMGLAGVFNALAFFSLGIALERTPVTRTNLINASQVALSALAGMLWFGEQPTVTIVAGITLTIVGLCLLRRNKPVEA